MAGSRFSDLALIFAQPLPGEYTLALAFSQPGDDAVHRTPPVKTGLDLAALEQARLAQDGQGYERMILTEPDPDAVYAVARDLYQMDQGSESK
jgi:hypothetical protein